MLCSICMCPAWQLACTCLHPHVHRPACNSLRTSCRNPSMCQRQPTAHCSLTPTLGINSVSSSSMPNATSCRGCCRPAVPPRALPAGPGIIVGGFRADADAAEAAAAAAAAAAVQAATSPGTEGTDSSGCWGGWCDNAAAARLRPESVRCVTRGDLTPTCMPSRTC
eukprot:365200-Chlamydomonas_euryale.AAC.8